MRNPDQSSHQPRPFHHTYDGENRNLVILVSRNGKIYTRLSSQPGHSTKCYGTIGMFVTVEIVETKPGNGSPGSSKTPRSSRRYYAQYTFGSIEKIMIQNGKYTPTYTSELPDHFRWNKVYRVTRNIGGSLIANDTVIEPTGSSH